MLGRGQNGRRIAIRGRLKTEAGGPFKNFEGLIWGCEGPSPGLSTEGYGSEKSWLTGSMWRYIRGRTSLGDSE